MSEAKHQTPAAKRPQSLMDALRLFAPNKRAKGAPLRRFLVAIEPADGYIERAYALQALKAVKGQPKSERRTAAECEEDHPVYVRHLAASARSLSCRERLFADQDELKSYAAEIARNSRRALLSEADMGRLQHLLDGLHPFEAPAQKPQSSQELFALAEQVAADPTLDVPPRTVQVLRELAAEAAGTSGAVLARKNLAAFCQMESLRGLLPLVRLETIPTQVEQAGGGAWRDISGRLNLVRRDADCWLVEVYPDRCDDKSAAEAVLAEALQRGLVELPVDEAAWGLDDALALIAPQWRDATQELFERILEQQFVPKPLSLDEIHALRRRCVVALKLDTHDGRPEDLQKALDRLLAKRLTVALPLDRRSLSRAQQLALSAALGLADEARVPQTFDAEEGWVLMTAGFVATGRDRNFPAAPHDVCRARWRMENAALHLQLEPEQSGRLEPLQQAMALFC